MFQGFQMAGRVHCVYNGSGYRLRRAVCACGHRQGDGLRPARKLGSSANKCDTIVIANGLNENVGLVTLSNTKSGSSYVTVRPQTQGGVRLTGKATDGVTNSLVKKLQKAYETSASDKDGGQWFCTPPQ